MPTLFIRFLDAVKPSEDGFVAELEWLTTDQGVVKNLGATDLRGPMCRECDHDQAFF